MNEAPTRTLLAWVYDESAPSFRHRLAAAAPFLEARGWRVRVETLPRGRYVRRVLERRADLRACDLLVLAKIKLTLGEWGLVRRSAGRVAFDLDDAVYLRRPRRPGQAPGRSPWRRYKFDRTCALADVVVAGNETLAEHARRRARRVVVLPTSVNAADYPADERPGRSGRRLVWIGRPENLGYLESLRPALAELARRFSGLKLRVICSEFPDWSELEVERVAWSEESEAESIAAGDIGLMPLSDDDWSRGKCAFKLLQCMAASLPCVASPVGANREAVVEGETGYLAETPARWSEALARLLGDAGLRRELGRAGRARVLERYDRQVLGPRWAAALEARSDSPRTGGLPLRP